MGIRWEISKTEKLGNTIIMFKNNIVNKGVMSRIVMVVSGN